MRLINADALMREFAEFVRESNNSDFAKVPTWNDAVSLLGSAPTIDPVKHGEWLPHPTEPDWDVCSVCRLGTRRRFHFNDGVYGGYDVEESFAYCPRCGAKMDGGESSICDNCDERSDTGCSWCRRMERSEDDKTAN